MESRLANMGIKGDTSSCPLEELKASNSTAIIQNDCHNRQKTRERCDLKSLGKSPEVPKRRGDWKSERESVRSRPETMERGQTKKTI